MVKSKVESEEPVSIEIIFPVTVELRPLDKGKLKAVADVTITLGDHGTLKISGFAVYSDGGEPTWDRRPGQADHGTSMWCP